MIRSDAWDGEKGTHALTLKVELMHEAEKQGRQHHFLPLSRPAPAHVGAAPPAKPYPTVGPRQQGASNPARRLPMLAPAHSNRNLVGTTGAKVKNKPFPTITTEN